MMIHKLFINYIILSMFDIKHLEDEDELYIIIGTELTSNKQAMEITCMNMI